MTEEVLLLDQSKSFNKSTEKKEFIFCKAIFS